MATVKNGRQSAVAETSRSRGTKVKSDDAEKNGSRNSQMSGRGETLPKIGKEEEKMVYEYDDGACAPVMFGDPFGNRGDYSKGIFYGGRNKYLVASNNNDKNANSLEPPEDFMTLRQRRDKAKMSKTQVQLISKRLDFKRKDDSDEAAILARAEAKKNLQASKCKIMVIKHQPTSKYDWTLQKQAGCKFWVHKPTGTVSNEMPCCEDDDDDSMCSTSDQDSQGGGFSPHRGTSSSITEEDGREDDEGGGSEQPPATGSLVYDSYEFDHFLNMLDEMQDAEATNKAAALAAKNRK